MKHSVSSSGCDIDFNLAGKLSMGEIGVRNLSAVDITYSSKIVLSLSKNAMIGFAKSLIRKAKSKESKGTFHLVPIRPGEDFTQVLGLIIAHNSVEPLITFWDVPQLEDRKSVV